MALAFAGVCQNQSHGLMIVVLEMQWMDDILSSRLLLLLVYCLCSKVVV